MSKKMLYDEFLALAKQKHGLKYNYNGDTAKFFNGSHSKIPIICPKHGEFWQIARSHLKYGCEKCSYEERAKSFRSNTTDFIEKARKIHGEKYDYSKVEYITAKNDKICIICPDHGEFWQLPNDHLSGKGCPFCNDSHLERAVSLFLTEHCIEFERNKKFCWLGRQSIDFYLPKYNIGIECQGKQHIGFGGWSKTYDFSLQQEMDVRKNELSTENGVKVLYLFSKEYENNIDSFSIYDRNNTFFDIKDLINSFYE